MSDDRLGPPTDGEPETGMDLARRALLAARTEAKRTAAQRKGAQRKGQGSTRRKGRSTSSTPSAAGPDERDPQPLSRTIDRLITERGWQTPAAVGGVLGRWAELVGTDVAAHCTPRSFEDGVLTVGTDSTAWATQLRLLAADLVRRLNVELGHGAITKINVRGPAAPSWSSGPRSVRGRGPRDTYG